MEIPKPSLNLVATSTSPDGLLPSMPKDITEDSRYSGQTDAFFKSVQWSADGTTLFTSSSSNRINTFVLPSDLLSPRNDDNDSSPLTLTPQGTLVLPEPSAAIAPCPYFALEHPSTQCLLTASIDHPIHLHHAFPQPLSPENDIFDPSTYKQPPPLATFRLIHPETERYTPITSLLWSYPGTHFLAGSTNCLSLFDVSRPDLGMSDSPLLTIKTTSSKGRSGNGAPTVGMKGTVSALAMQPLSNSDYGNVGSIVAAGTWTRNMGLFDLHRAGACVATWNVSQAATLAKIGGRGVLQTVWSPCGRYLVVNERESGGLLVYDVRGTHRLLACLNGRDGETNQRLSCDVFPGTNADVGGFEVWAGTKDGKVVVWEGVGMQEAMQEKSYDFEVVTHGRRETAVGGTAMHLSGSVLATCSGSWKFPDDNEDDDDESSGSEELDSEQSSESESDADSEDDESGSSSSESSSEQEERRTTRQRQSRPRPPPAVVEETSLKVWSITAGTMAESGHQEEFNEPYVT